jgi:hypothetical protein
MGTYRPDILYTGTVTGSFFTRRDKSDSCNEMARPYLKYHRTSILKLFYRIISEMMEAGLYTNAANVLFFRMVKKCAKSTMIYRLHSLKLWIRFRIK